MGKNLVQPTLLIIIGILTLALVIPLLNVNWGTLSYAPASTITVTGEANSQEQNQVARFSAGVMALNQDKQAAINEINTKMETIITAVKDFGIPTDNIKTENLSINQEEVFNDDTRTSTPGQWRANNTISIKLEDINRASELAGLLTSSGATNVYGPNFTLEQTEAAEVELVNQALDNARQKAEAIAKGSGQTLGEVISVSEAGTTQPGPIMAMEGRGGGAPLEPGTTTVSQSLTVTFELK